MFLWMVGHFLAFASCLAVGPIVLLHYAPAKKDLDSASIPCVDPFCLTSRMTGRKSLLKVAQRTENMAKHGMR